MKRNYSDLLKRVMVSIISLSMIVQPAAPALAAQSQDDVEGIVAGTENDGAATDAEDIFIDADAGMEAVNDEESLSEISGAEEDVEIAETEAVEDMEEALDASGDEEDVNGAAAVSHILDITQLVNANVLAPSEYNDNAGKTIPNAQTEADKDLIGLKPDGSKDPFFTIWAHNSSKTPVSNPGAERAPFPDGYLDEKDTATETYRWSPNGPFGAATKAGAHPTKAIQFTTGAETNTVKVWWEGGDIAREIGLYDSKQELSQTTEVNTGDVAGTNKNGASGKGSYVSTFSGVGKGVWYLGSNSESGGSYFYKVEVIEGALDFTGESWSDVKTPSANKVYVSPVTVPETAKTDAEKAAATRTCKSTVIVDVAGCAINDLSAANRVSVYMAKTDTTVESMTPEDVKKNAVGVYTIMKDNSAAGAADNKATFLPATSGRFFFVAAAERDKDSNGKAYAPKYSNVLSLDFIRPLDTPSIAGVTDHGDGTLTVAFAAVQEADYYVVTNNASGADKVTVKVDSDEAKKYYTESAKLYRVPIKAKGLTKDKEYTFKVNAYRNIYNATDTVDSIYRDISVTAEFKYTYHNRKENEWLFSAYGTSTDKSYAEKGVGNNFYEGNANDGSVHVWALKNGGKIVPLSMDGVSFYYTAVPKDKNFKLTAKAHVNNWAFSNGQEGFGVMAADRVGKPGDSDYWNNCIQSVATKIEYRYDLTNDEYTDDIAFSKVNMYLGLSALARYGVTQDNLSIFEKTPAAAMKYFSQNQTPLDHSCAPLGGGTYNIVKNYGPAHEYGVDVTKLKSFNKVSNLKKGLTQTPDLEREDFIMTVEKNNSGYFVTYEDAVTHKKETKKYYDSRFYDEVNQPLYNKETKDKNALAEALKKPGILETLDDGYVYAGVFCARNADVTFNDIQFTETDAMSDDYTESPEKTSFDNTSDFLQITNSNSSEFDLYYLPSWRGELQITNASGKILYDSTTDPALKGLNGKKDKNKDGKVPADKYITLPVTLSYGANTFKAIMKPDETYHYNFDPDDPDSDPANYNNILKSYDTRVTTITVNLRKYGEEGTYLYVSPEGTSSGDGTIGSPLDIYTAVKYVQTGQQILLGGGEYRLTKPVRIERGIDGTKDNMIYMMPDPDATERPVFDFLESSAGMVIGGNYWYIKGIEIKRASDGNKGIQVAGSHCILEDLETHHNGNNGIDISRLYSADEAATLYPEGVCKGEQIWPHDNLILNCTSYENSDAGYEDADGFTCKLTVGEGNVFDGCIAYCNADDGWDLYSKSETGEIGRVTIKNSVSFMNGYIHRDKDEDGKEELVVAGNGNGIKMGGETLPGGHTVINCFAFLNKAKGIDSNSCPDIKAFNCISYGNQSYNVSMTTNNNKETGYTARNLISLYCRKELKVTSSNGSTEDATDKVNDFDSEGKEDTGKGTTDVEHESVFLTNLNKQGTPEEGSLNKNGVKFNPDMIKPYKGVSFSDEDAIRTLVQDATDPNKSEPLMIGRKADGTVDMNGFLELKDEAYTTYGLKGRIAINGALPDYMPTTHDYKDRPALIDYSSEKRHPNTDDTHPTYKKVGGEETIAFITNPVINTGVEDGRAGTNGSRKEYKKDDDLIASSGTVEKGTNDNDSASVAVYPDVESIEPEAETVVVGRIKDQYYTGAQVLPDILVINGKGDAQTTLTRGKDYIVQFKNNIKAGVANVAVTGTGNYKNKFYYVDEAGKKSEVTFKILPVSLEKGFTIRRKNTTTSLYERTEVIETEDYMVAESGKTSKPPVPTVTYDNGKSLKKLKAGTDFTITYLDAAGNVVDNPTDVGMYTIRITGTYQEEAAEDGTISNTGGNFTGSRDITYVIYDPSASNVIDKNLIPKVERQFLNKKGTRPFNLTTNNRYVESSAELAEGESLVYPIGELKLGTDYVVSYSKNKKKGSATASIVGIGACAGKVVVKFSIAPAKIKYGSGAATVSYNGADLYPEGVEYNGSPITLNHMIKVYYIGDTNVKGKKATDLNADGSGKKLVLGKDYKITYKKHKFTGKAAAFVSGIGDYAGRFTHTYQINPISEDKMRTLLGKDLIIETQANQDEKYRAGYSEGTSVSCDKGYYMHYSKKGASPDINITLYGNLLKNGRDYKVTYYNVPDPNSHKDYSNRSYYVVVFDVGIVGKVTNDDYNKAMKEKGGAAGDVNEMRYTIEKGLLSSDTAFAEATDVVWKNDKTKIKTSFNIYEFESKKKLMSGKDYNKDLTFTYDSDVVVDGQTVAKAGDPLDPKTALAQPDDDGYNILVTIPGTGRYEGSITTSIHVAKNDISKAIVTKTVAKEWKAYDKKLYTGIELEKNDFEGLLVYGDDKQPLVLGKDYVIDTTYDMNRRVKDVQLFAKNDRCGTASVVVRGKGKYSGVRTIFYRVVPKPMIPEDPKAEEGQDQQQQ